MDCWNCTNGFHTVLLPWLNNAPRYGMFPFLSLQAVLDRMDDLAASLGDCGEPAEHPDPKTGTTAPRARLMHGVLGGGTLAAGPAPQGSSRRRALAAAACAAPLANRGAVSCRAEAAQLCRQFSQLLDSSDTELRQARHELELARRAEGVVDRIGTAALEAALAAAEAGAEAASARGRGSMPVGRQACTAEVAAAERTGLCCPLQAVVATALGKTAQHVVNTGAGSGSSTELPVPALHRTQTTDPPAVPSAGASPQCSVVETGAASGEPSSSTYLATVEAAQGGDQLVSGQAAEASFAGLPQLPEVPGGCHGSLRELLVPSAPCTLAEPAPAAAGAALHLTGDVQQMVAEDGVAAPCPSDSLPAVAVRDAGGMGVSADSHETLLEPPSNSSSPGLTGSDRNTCSDGTTAAASQRSCSVSSLADALREQMATAEHAGEVADEPAGAEQQEGGQELGGRWRLAELAAPSGPPMADAWDPAAAALGPATDAEQSAASAAATPVDTLSASMPTACDFPGQTSHAASACQREQGGTAADPSAAWLAGSPGWQAGEADPCAAAGAERPAAEAEVHPLLDLSKPLEGEGAPVPSPAASQAPPRAPYNPLRADEQRAVAARRAEHAAGWRRLRERVDVLALWHEYATELGLDAAPIAADPAAASNAPAAAGDRAAQLHVRPPMQAPGCEESRAVAASPGLALPVFQSRPPNGRLWQPDRALPLAAIKAAPHLATTLLPASVARESSASAGSSITRASSSCMTTSSEGTSVGIAARWAVSVQCREC